MWLFYGLSSLVGLVLVGPYIARRVGEAVSLLAPRVPTKVGRVVKWAYFAALYALPLAVVVMVLYHRRWLRPPDSVWFDYALLYPFWLGFAWSVQCAVLMLPADALRWLAWRWWPARASQWRRWHAYAVVAVTAVFAVYVPARVAYDDSHVIVRHGVVEVQDLPPALDGLRVVFVADLQADRHTGEDDLARYVQTINAERPDLVLIGGDLITSGPRYIEAAARHAGQIEATHGVYSCVGDHDNWAFGRDYDRSVSEITRALAAHGVTMVDDDVVGLDIGGARLAMLFSTHNYMQRSDRDTLDRLIDEARDSDFRVVVTHQPTAALIDHARDRVDLYLAGHTHGGQISLWFPGFDLNPARVETRYARGWYRAGAMPVVVSSGLGVSLAPLRYRSPPTVDVIELRRK